MKALTLINLCARDYQDTAFVRVGKDAATTTAANGANWLDWLNDAQNAVVLVRPDASAITQNIVLVAGSRQILPAGSQRLLAVTRNMGADGLTPGRALRIATHEEQDAVNLEWHSEAAGAVVREVIYDDRKDPLSFWTRPPATAGYQIEATISAAPATITNPDTGDISVSDIYSSALQAWMMHRCYAMATQALNQFQRSTFYFTSFFNLLGVKLRGEMFAGPYARGQMPAPPEVATARQGR